MQVHFNFHERTQEMTIKMFTVNTTFKIATRGTLILETNLQYYGIRPTGNRPGC